MNRHALAQSQVPLFLSGATELRVVVKPQPECEDVGKWRHASTNDRHCFTYVGLYVHLQDICPYPVGSELALTETWRIGAWNEDTGCVAVDYKADGFCRREWLKYPDPTGDGSRFNDLWIECTIEAEDAGMQVDGDGQYQWEPGQSPCRWRRAITMPAEFSRFPRRVAAVRAEHGELWEWVLTLEEA